MDISILLLLSLQTTLILMWVFTLKDKLDRLEGEIRANTVHLDLRIERLNADLEEKAHFQEKALGTLAQNVALVGYEVKEVKDKIETSTEGIKDGIRKSTHIIVTTPVKARI